MHINGECTAGAYNHSDHSELCKVSTHTFITVQLSRLRMKEYSILKNVSENVQSTALRLGGHGGKLKSKRGRN